MRYYLVDQQQNEHVFELSKTHKRSKQTIEFEFRSLKNNKPEKSTSLFVRQLAGKCFVSTDCVKWNKMARQTIPESLLHIDTNYNLFRGFKPANLTKGGEGQLRTQMPGKVVKILVEEGQEVKVGDPLVILEAMKMENEIVCSKEGVIRNLQVKEGDTLDQGVALMDIE